MKTRVMPSVVAVLGFVFLVFSQQVQPAGANEELPWGKAVKQNRVITPSTSYEPDAYDSGIQDNYDTSSGDYSGNEPSRTYQQEPDYSTYRPVDPLGDDVDDGLDQYDDEINNQNRNTYRRRNPSPEYAKPGQEQAPNRLDGTFTANEIVVAGHDAFGKVTRGFAAVVEYAFQKQGRPNGYIIGQEAGGAFVAGLRYGEGILHTKNAGTHRVYWQGPSVGYDFGAEGSKTMILVYDIERPSDVYGRFAGVDGSAYLVGGVGITFQQRDHVTMAPIRSGVGLRLGANIGYLKYSRAPTWNPF